VKEGVRNLSFEGECKIGDFSVNEVEEIKNECVRVDLNYGVGIGVSKKMENVLDEIYGRWKNNEIELKEFGNGYENGELG
ncbi:hypothetical protein, partial [Bacillus subtilis]|uniref:hypothetical protein n=1 Tax=Bacillus subtilis TaxID=1423 RepID=UPI0020787BE2